MALTDEDIEEIYAIINEALEANDLKQRSESSRYAGEKNSLDLEYKQKRAEIKARSRGRTPRRIIHVGN